MTSRRGFLGRLLCGALGFLGLGGAAGQARAGQVVNGLRLPPTRWSDARGASLSYRSFWFHVVRYKRQTTIDADGRARTQINIEVRAPYDKKTRAEIQRAINSSILETPPGFRRAHARLTIDYPNRMATYHATDVEITPPGDA